MQNQTTYEQQAYELGVQHAKNAASWIIDGNTSQDHIARMAKMMDDGDPALDQFLPNTPNLSGEWADDPTPQWLIAQVLPEGVDPDPIIDDLCEAYERGVDETFEPECERIIRAAIS